MASGEEHRLVCNVWVDGWVGGCLKVQRGAWGCVKGPRRAPPLPSTLARISRTAFFTPGFFFAKARVPCPLLQRASLPPPTHPPLSFTRAFRRHGSRGGIPPSASGSPAARSPPTGEEEETPPKVTSAHLLPMASLLPFWEVDLGQFNSSASGPLPAGIKRGLAEIRPGR